VERISRIGSPYDVEHRLIEGNARVNARDLGIRQHARIPWAASDGAALATEDMTAGPPDARSVFDR